MKIIAVTATAYGGTPETLLVEMSADELDKLTGTSTRCREREQNYTPGKKLSLDKVWNFNWTFRTLFNDRAKLVGALRDSCEKVEKIELPTLELP